MYTINSTGGNMTLVAKPPGTEGTFIYRATLDLDGIFRLYSHSPSGSVTGFLDVTGLDGKCLVKGFCGLNSYCELEDDEPKCFCPPGFDFIHPDRWFLGCQRNSTVPGCADNQLMVNITYGIVSVENLEWPDIHPYYVLPTDRDGCNDKCLKDCNCDVAIYQNGNCRKLGLPVKYGRNVAGSSSSTSFFKFGALPTDASSAIEPNHGGMEGAGNTHGSGESRNPAVLLAITIVFVVCLIVLFAFSAFLIHAIRTRRYRNILVDGNLALFDEIAVRSYSYNDLVEAFDNFKEELGRGGFGAVYRGSLHSSGRSVAVKRLLRQYPN
ncbi:hypothetical protein ACLOJK_029936 [Asimina triloba]